MKITKVHSSQNNTAIYRGNCYRMYRCDKRRLIRLARACNASPLKNVNRYTIIAGQICRRFGLLAFHREN